MCKLGLTGGIDAADDPDEADTGEKAARPRGGRRRPLLHPLVSPLRDVDLTLLLPFFSSSLASSSSSSSSSLVSFFSTVRLLFRSQLPRVRSSGSARIYANRGDPRRVPVIRTLATRIPRSPAALFTSLCSPRSRSTRRKNTFKATGLLTASFL